MGRGLWPPSLSCHSNYCYGYLRENLPGLFTLENVILSPKIPDTQMKWGTQKYFQSLKHQKDIGRCFISTQSHLFDHSNIDTVRDLSLLFERLETEIAWGWTLWSGYPIYWSLKQTGKILITFFLGTFLLLLCQSWIVQ